MISIASLTLRNQFSFSHPSFELTMELSAWAFSIGLPGLMKLSALVPHAARDKVADPKAGLQILHFFQEIS